MGLGMVCVCVGGRGWGRGAVEGRLLLVSHDRDSERLGETRRDSEAAPLTCLFLRIGPFGLSWLLRDFCPDISAARLLEAVAGAGTAARRARASHGSRDLHEPCRDLHEASRDLHGRESGGPAVPRSDAQARRVRRRVRPLLVARPGRRRHGPRNRRPAQATAPRPSLLAVSVAARRFSRCAPFQLLRAVSAASGRGRQRAPLLAARLVAAWARLRVSRHAGSRARLRGAARRRRDRAPLLCGVTAWRGEGVVSLAGRGAARAWTGNLCYVAYDHDVFMDLGGSSGLDNLMAILEGIAAGQDPHRIPVPPPPPS